MRKALTFILFVAAGAAAFAQNTRSISVSLAPTGSIPLGPDAAYFSFGAGGELTAGLDGVIPVVSPRLSVGYDYVALATLGGVHLVHAGAGLAMPLSLTAALSISPYLLGGYTYGIITDGTGQGGGPFVKGGLSLSVALGPVISLGLDASYRWDVGAWSGVGVSLLSTVKIPIMRSAAAQRAVKGVELLSAQLQPVLPAQFKLYDGRPFGSFTLHNLEKTPLTDVSVDFFVGSYMDNPTRLLTLPRLDPDARQEVPVKALFSEQVLKITEATKVSGRVSVSFVLDGQPYSCSRWARTPSPLPPMCLRGRWTSGSLRP